MSQQHGRRYEHQLVNGLDEITPEEVWVTSCGYSGNSKADGCDMVITVDPSLALRNDTRQINVEAKKRQGESGQRISNVFSGSSGDETGLDELDRLVENTPVWADPVAAIKFDRRKLLVLDARWLLSYLDVIDRVIPPTIASVFSVVQPRLTPSESVSMVKPDTGQWPSSQASRDDVVVLADRLGLPYEVEEDDG